MKTSAHALPVRRLITALAATALAAGPVGLLGPEQAAGSERGGSSAAAVLRAGLDVSLMNRSVRVPLHTSLDAVRAPRHSERTSLAVRLDGRPVSLLSATAATARATADEHRAEASSNLADAEIHLPGLPLLSLIEVEAVSSHAVCTAGRRPRAEAKLPGTVRILGKRITVTSGGPPTRVAVPGVGDVTLGFSQTRVTGRTAAASALDLKVSVNPLKLNVAEVKGRVTLVESSCEAPRGAPAEAGAKPAGGAKPVPARKASGTRAPDLAETGGGPSTPYLAGGGALLLAAGAGAVALARRRGTAGR